MSSTSSATPASAITSTSPSFWQVMPTAPARICMLRERGELVRLDVRPVGEAVLVAVALHARDVPLDRVQVDGRDRRVERDDVHVSSSSQTTASPSTSKPTRSDWIVVRAGIGSEKNARYAASISSKCAMSLMYMPTRTAFCSEPPAARATASRFSSTWRTCSATLTPTRSPTAS